MATTTEPVLSKTEQIRMLRTMMLIRRFEERCAEWYTRGKIGGFLHLYIGEEAVATGVISALSPQDKIVTHYRDHGHALARGLDTNACMAELFGKATGLSKGKGGSMHLFDVSKGFMGGHAIVGAQMPLAVGLALAAKYRDEDTIVLCIIGDGAVNEGEFHESMNLASLWKLPVFFLLENNGFGMGTRVERASAQPEIFRLAERHNVKNRRFEEGMDVIGIYDAAREAVEYIRSGAGPYFLEVMTYRFRGHSMADPIEYREHQEVAPWLEKDPINHLSERLVAEGLASQTEIDALQEEVDRETEEAVQFADESPFPEPGVLYEDIYA